MRISFFAWFLVLVLVFSCSGPKHNYSVEILCDHSNGGMVYLAERTIAGTFVVDSAMPDKSGKYILEGYAKQPDFYIVYINPRHFINLIIHPGDDFRVLTHVAEFDRNYIVEGSKDSRLIQKMVNMQTRTLEQITEISEKYENSKGQKDFGRISISIDSIYETVVAAHKEFSLDLIRNNPKSLASLMALYQQLGRNVPVFDYKKDLGIYEMVDSNLIRLYPNAEAVIDLNRKVTELRDLLKLDIGSQAPEIALPDSSGRLIHLSSLRGQNVLIIFWASWSSRSVTELKKFAAMLPASGDMILYQVSLDRTRSSWLNHITDKNTRDIHVSDLQYWDSPVVDLYHIENVPVVFLLNKDGIIIKKDISANEFQSILKELSESK